MGRYIFQCPGMRVFTEWSVSARVRSEKSLAQVGQYFTDALCGLLNDGLDEFRPCKDHVAGLRSL